MTDFRAEHSISGIVRALSYKTTTQAVKSSKMLFNPQSPVKFVPQKVLSPIQIWVGVLGKIVGWWLRGHWGAGSNDGLTDWMAEDNEAAETGPGNHQLVAEGSRCQAGYFGSTECSRYNAAGINRKISELVIFFPNHWAKSRLKPSEQSKRSR